MGNKIYYLNSMYACPVCNSILKQAKSDMLILRCMCCNSLFKAVDTFHSADVLQYEEIEIKK